MTTDPLLQRAKLAQEKNRKADEFEQNRPRSPFENLVEKAHKTGTFAHRAYETADVVWNFYLKPVTFFLNPIIKGYWNTCKWAFNKVSFDSDGDYKKFRGAAMAVGLSALTVFAGYHTAVNAIPLALKTSFDAVAIETMSYQDTLLFGKAENLDNDKNIWSVSACRQFPCEGQVDSIEFRMQDSPYLDLKRFFTDFQPHDPGELAGAFNSEQNACNITTYGVRVKIPLAPISWGFYPHPYEATCVPVDSDNWQQQLDFMKSIRSDLAKPQIEFSQGTSQPLITSQMPAPSSAALKM